MGKLQHEFSKSTNTVIDSNASIRQIRDKTESLRVPEDFKNVPEFRRRSEGALQRYLGNEYMLSIQNEQGFNLKDTLSKVPKTSTPDSLHEQAATMENRVLTQGEKVDPKTRLRNGTMDQQDFLELSTKNLAKEKMETGTVSPEGPISLFAKESYKMGLRPSDVANYATINGVEIPQETISRISTMTDQSPKANKPDLPQPAPTGPKP